MVTLAGAENDLGGAIPFRPFLARAMSGGSGDSIRTKSTTEGLHMIYDKGFAIVGIGCRFPGGIDSLDGLWKVLSEGTDVVTSIPGERFDLGRYWHPDRKAPGRTCTTSAGIVGDLTQFDATFFGMSPKEAEALDPQQRMVLEMAWEAFEDAGIPPSSVAGTKAAVYVGAASTDMGMIRSDDMAVTGPYGMTGTSLSIIANRLSYFFDLHGPSMTIDTACSSSLVALNEACRAMAEENLPMALVGGVNALLSPMPFVGFSKAHMLSEDGRCKVFDAKGNGYVRSEGGAVIILKPLEAALAAGDAIHAVIRATGVNSDGRTAGIALPNGDAQAALLTSIYTDPRVPASRVAYVEAHGTGTAAGDPIETASIGRVLGRPGAEPLPVGSVKSNVGHLETGSGMAGLAKALTVLEKKTIPANILLNEPNPKIDFAGLGIRVPTVSEPLPKTDGPALVGLNSFGFGGTNAHAVLEEAPEAPEAPEVTDVKDGADVAEVAASPQAADSRLLPLLVSAKSRESLKALARAYAERVKGLSPAEFNRTAAAAARQRERLPHAVWLRAETPDEAALWLTAYADTERFPEGATAAYDHATETKKETAKEKDTEEKTTGATACAACASSSATRRRVRTAFVYSGNGSQWVGMGAELLKTNARFRAAIERVDAIFAPLSGWSIADYLAKPAADWTLERTEIAQPLLFAMQIGMTELLRAEGIDADAATGHSVGEVAAAWASGALTLEDAVTVIYERSLLQGRMAGSGTMAAVKLPEARLKELLASYPGVEIAGYNAPDNYTLSGDPEGIEQLRTVIKSEGGLCKLLGIPYAFHSSRMAPLEGDVRRTLGGLAPKASRALFVSSVDGKVTEGGMLTADYWWRNIREAVRFESAVETLLDLGVDRFVEVGPHGILTGYVRAIAKAKNADAKTLFVMRREDGAASWGRSVSSVAAAWPHAALLAAWPSVSRDRTLPRYRWAKKRFWAEATPESRRLFVRDPDEHPLLGRRIPHAKNAWEAVFDLQTRPWLAGHEIDATVLFPAAGFLEVAAEAARRALNPERALELKNLMILRPAPLADAPAKVFSTKVDDAGTLTLSTRDEMSEDDALVNLSGRATVSDAPRPVAVNPEAFLRDAEQTFEVDPFYERLAAEGLCYAGAFRPIEAALVVKNESESARIGLEMLETKERAAGTHRVVVKLASRSEEADRGEGLSPALVDGALQGLFFALEEAAANAKAAAEGASNKNSHKTSGASGSSRATYLPTWFERTVIWERGTPVWATADLLSLTDRSAKALYTLYDAQGNVLARLEGVRFLRVHKKAKGVLPAFYSEAWYAADTDRASILADGVCEAKDKAETDATTSVSDISRSLCRDLSCALSDTARSMEWNPAAALDADTLLLWTVLAGLYESVPVKDEWVAEETLLTNGAWLAEELEPWAKVLVDRMVENGLAERNDGLVRVLSAADCPAYDDLFRTILAESPELWPELTALDTLDARRADLVAGDVTADVVFPKRATVMKALFERMPKRALAPYALCRYVREATEALSVTNVKNAKKAKNTAVRPNVLLVTRSGSTYAKLLASTLPRSVTLVIAADDSEEASMLERLRAEYAENPRVKVTGISQLADTFPATAFDAVLLPEGLAFLADPAACLKTLAARMLPGAPLFLVEEAPNTMADILNGADAAWWHAEGNGTYSGPLADEAAWLAALDRAGFAAKRVDTEETGLAPRMLIAAVAKSAEASHEKDNKVEKLEKALNTDRLRIVAGAWVDGLSTDVKDEGAGSALSPLSAPRATLLSTLVRATGVELVTVSGAAAGRSDTLNDTLDRLTSAWSKQLAAFPAGTRVLGFFDFVKKTESTETTTEQNFAETSDAFPHELFAFCRAAAAAEKAGTLPEGLEVVVVTDALSGVPGVSDVSGEDDVILESPAARAAVGLLRVFANECPSVTVRTIALQDGSDASIERASAELLRGVALVGATAGTVEGTTEASKEALESVEQFESETAVSAGRLYRRYVETCDLSDEATESKESKGQTSSNACGAAVATVRRTLAFDVPGKLDHLYWKSDRFTAPLGENEVEIDVRATGLNFRDVMWAMGLLPEEALENGFSGPTMGLEASGVVRRTGKSVTSVKPGDAVVAFAPACFSTVVRTTEEAVAKKPSNLTFAEAASVPVAFFTSWYAIHYLGRARRGESILIHGAAGGAGLAAIQIAAHLGLEVFATAGSDAKRSLLKRLGVKHVYDSRSLAFADEIRRDTKGRGVDLVLNSLAGNGAEKSLGLLAPFGRFLELGKRDFYADSPMFLRPFRRNISYFGIDVDQMLVECPALASDLFRELLARFEEGVFRPLPLMIFPADAAGDAFATMQSSVHIGKLVVGYRTEREEAEEADETKDATEAAEANEANDVTETSTEALPRSVSGRTVVLSGGLGGLGRKAAEHYARAGATGLVLLSRRGLEDKDAAEFVRSLEANFTGLKVEAPALDVAGGCDTVVTTLLSVLESMPPLAGVVHAAGVLADAMIPNLTTDACDRVWGPKVKGAENLLAVLEAYKAREDEGTKETKEEAEEEEGDAFEALDKKTAPFCVLFSSATVLLGNPGQANYVAANAALEVLAERARRAGFVSRAIGWGPVGDVGMLKANPSAKKILESTLGTPALDSTEVLAALDAMVEKGGNVPLHFFAIDWSRVDQLPAARDPRFAGIWATVGEKRADAGSIRDLLTGKSEEEAVGILTELVASEVAKLMGVAASELNAHQPVADLGMDSLMVVELAAALEERLGFKIPAVSLSGGATIRTMAERFRKMMNVENEGEQTLDDLAHRHGVALSAELKEGVLADVGASGKGA